MYELLRFKKTDNESIKLNVAGVRGLAISIDSVDPDTQQVIGKLTGPKNRNYLGHLTRAVVTEADSVPLLREQVFGTSVDGKTLEGPDIIGKETSVEFPSFFRAQGASLFVGANAITANTSLHTECTFENGLPRVAQPLEHVFCIICGELTPKEELDGTTPDFAFMFQMVDPYQLETDSEPDSE